MPSSRGDDGATGRGLLPVWIRVCLMAAVAVAGVLLVVGTPGAPAAGAQTEIDCLGCHDRDELNVELPSGEVLDGTVDRDVYEASAHGGVGLSCTSCHRSIDEFPHEKPSATDAREYTVDANEVCSGCHESAAAGVDDEHAVALASGSPDAPVCSSCHGAHDIAADPGPSEREAMCSSCHEPSLAAAAGVHIQGPFDGASGAEVACSDCHGSHTVLDVELIVPTACATCHDSEVGDYHGSAHGLAQTGGDRSAASCADCHGTSHEILPADDPGSPSYPLNLPETCGGCHGDPEFAEEHGLTDVFSQYVDSIHGRAVLQDHLLIAANCSTCHGSHAIASPDDPSSSVYKANIPTTCGECHGDIEALYRDGVHGDAVAEGDFSAAVCVDCHTAHEIADVDTVEWKLEVVRECGTCHEESLTTYRDTFHGQVTSLGYTRVARCSDCHEEHDIHEVGDPRSSVSEARIVETCQECHPNANEAFAQFSPHLDAHDPDDAPVYYTNLFMTTLIVGVLGFFGVHSVLWGVRAGIDRGTLFGRRARSDGESTFREQDEEP